VTTTEVSWQKQALIAKLAMDLESTSRQFGKVALQKMMFLLQELFAVPVGYDFELYHVGPFSRDLQADLDYAHFLQAVSIVETPPYGFRILPGAQSETIASRGHAFLARHTRSIEGAEQEFGSMSARELELRATLVYVAKWHQKRAEAPKRDQVVEEVAALKSKYARQEIEEALDELRRAQHIEVT